MDEEKKGHVRWAMWFALCVLAVCAAMALHQKGILKTLSSIEDLRKMMDAAGPLAGAVYFVLQMMTVIFAPIPSNMTMMAGALVLGFLKALVLGVLAVVLGSVLIFLAARKLGQKSIRKLLDRGVMDKYLPVIQEKQEMFLFLTMLFPFFPDDMLCILAGLTQMPLARFVLIMVLARPWGLVFAALLGGGVIHLPIWGWIALGLAMAAVFCLALRYSTQIEEKMLKWIGQVTQRTEHKRRKDDHTCAVSQSGD